MIVHLRVILAIDDRGRLFVIVILVVNVWQALRTRIISNSYYSKVRCVHSTDVARGERCTLRGSRMLGRTAAFLRVAFADTDTREEMLRELSRDIVSRE